MQSLLGKFVGGLTALVGVFTITLPIPIVVNSFAGFYKNRLWRNEVALKKRQRVQKEREMIKREIEERVVRGELDMDEVIDNVCITFSLVSLLQIPEEMSNVRSNREMTVADMMRLGE